MRHETQAASAIAPFTGWRRAPESLSDRGKEIWRNTLDQIPGLILPLHAWLVERFCDALDFFERLERDYAACRDADERSVLKGIVDERRLAVMALAEELGLTPASHRAITENLKIPENVVAHQALKKALEGKPRRSRPMGGRRKPRE